MIRVQGSIPYPPTANSIPIRQFAGSLRQLSSGLQQTSAQLTATAGSASSAWAGAAAEAFGRHVGQRAGTVRTVATETATAATVLETYAAAIDTTSAAYSTAATAEHAARAGLPWTAAALAAAIVAEQAAYAAFLAAGAACKGALVTVNVRLAASLFLGVDASAFSSIGTAVLEVWNQVSGLIDDDSADDEARLAATHALDAAMWDTGARSGPVGSADDPLLGGSVDVDTTLAGFGTQRCSAFADEIRGGANPLDGTLAALTGDAYRTEGWHDGGQIGEWRRVTADELPEAMTWQHFENDRWYSGMRAALFTDDDGRYVLAFAGWNDDGGLGLPSDLLNSVDQGLGGTPYQYDQALELARRLSAGYGSDLVITGHSLGGSLAAYASLGTGAPAVTYNAAGLHADNLVRASGLPLAEATTLADSNIRNYRLDGDIVTNLQEGRNPLGDRMPDAAGRQIDLADTAPAPQYRWTSPFDSGTAAVDHALAMHQIDTVVGALGAQQPWGAVPVGCTGSSIVIGPPDSTTGWATDAELGTAPWFSRPPVTNGVGGR